MNQSGTGDAPPETADTQVPLFEDEVPPPKTSTATPVVVEGSHDQRALTVRLERAYVNSTSDQSFWAIIRDVSEHLGYNSYEAYLEPIMCGQMNLAVEARRNTLPFPGVSAYALLKAASEVFVLLTAGVSSQNPDQQWSMIENDRGNRMRLAYPARVKELRFEWEKNYLERGPAGPELPYMSLIRTKLGLPVVDDDKLGMNCHGLLRSRVNNPLLVELIWSYWLEEGMLAQTMNAISMRFQNRRRPGPRDPLLRLEVDPLRPLSSLLWGFVQDEQHRLTVTRRAHEYAHQYGFTLEGRAVQDVRPADKRSRFIEVFHTLLYECMRFYRVDDDTTMVADAFPVLRNLKILDRIISESSHNQFGDLGWVARIEMMMMQWILARPEVREYLGGRGMVALSEPWMEQVDAMKTLQRWTDTDIGYFRDLAVFGERILLTLRYGNWTTIIYPQNAANWARYWRPEIQGYIDAYLMATGVDLEAQPPSDAAGRALRFAPPSIHLGRRLKEQRKGA